jgi:transposase
MERMPKGIYTPEFRAEAVKLVKTTGMSMPKSSLDNWVRVVREAKIHTQDSHQVVRKSGMVRV